MKIIGIWAHILRNARRRSAGVVSLGHMSLNHLWTLSHKCSMRFKFRLRAGHGMLLMLCCWRKSMRTGVVLVEYVVLVTGDIWHDVRSEDGQCSGEL